MRRSCPHCGQEQVVADEEIQAPWVFTRCHRCENLSILRKEGAPEPVAPEPAALKPSAVQARQAVPSPRVETPRAPSLAAREIRPDAVLGAFASAARESARPYRAPLFAAPGIASIQEEKEWQLPTYFSPYSAESERVVSKIPPATPAFLRRARAEAHQGSALETLAQAIREEAKPAPEAPPGPSAESSEEELPELPGLDPLSTASESTPASLDTPKRDASPPSSGGGSAKRKQRLMGAGVLLVGVGLGLLVLKPARRTPEPKVETIPGFAPQPAAFAPVRPAPVAVPPPAPAAAPASVPATKRVPSGFWIVSVTGTRTSLRAGPGKQFNVLGEVETGSRWKVRKWEGEWFQVEPENLGPGTLGIGWIRNDLVKPEANGGPS